MSNVIPFDFNSCQLRVVEQDGEPWFVLADVCRVLELSNPTVVAERLDEDEKGNPKSGLGLRRDQLLINESGLYAVVLRSDKPTAKPFRRWVTHDVLPSIRKTGQYLSQRSSGYPELAKNHRARLQLARMCGLKGPKAILAANSWTEREEGVDVLGLVGVTHLTSSVQSAEITASELGVRAGLPGKGKGCAQNVNLCLWHLGLLDTVYDKRGSLAWRISSKGMESGHLEYDDVTKKHGQRSSVQTIVYRESLLSLIQGAGLVEEDFKQLKIRRKAESPLEEVAA
ncbi:Bro-N domain-containing protein [Microbulbifer sp. OS29]|uniref:Bro-N domain-containing protein n=1 Tax=Microbulbifer okhotskensis TaxID=2926617 RepID=A0A9X2ES72_9GAMM|nr:Bro-N domain-containing protein [Microbulbifer okhotskensis]MCO1336425.1 Bro-N domain-containing protein [Microbulbifer okhotskensis]